MDLAEFLLARISDDEAWARQQERAAIRTHHVARRASFPPGHYSRLLADCAAKRRIVEEYQLLAASPDERAGQRAALRWVLEQHAQAYAGHPDYRPEFAPDPAD